MSESSKYINPDNMDENTGLPNKIYNKSFKGNRQLWARNSGLSRLYLSRSLYLGSDGGGGSLADSNDNGRIADYWCSRDKFHEDPQESLLLSVLNGELNNCMA